MKKNYWLRGLTIGAVIGISTILAELPLILACLNYQSSTSKGICVVLIWPLALISPLKPLFNALLSLPVNGRMIVLSFANIALFIILFTAIGWLYGKIKNRSKLQSLSSNL